MENFDRFQSPFTWRYGSEKMREIWSERNKRKLWRHIWIALARAESRYGLVTPSQIAELESHADDIDFEEANRIEDSIHHDLMAELRVFASQCLEAGGVLHLGATSMDIEDNADVLRIRDSLSLVKEDFTKLLLALAGKIEDYASLPAMAFTHLQPAEPTTIGYRYACYAQDLAEAYERLSYAIADIRGKGFKGAVGTSASYAELIGLENLDDFERVLSEDLGIEFFDVSTQTYARVQDYRIISLLAEIAAILHKMAFDFRILQMPMLGEICEPFGEHQIGSSAMPFKRNPIECERIESLARLFPSFANIAWDNAALSILERTLDDSANRRIILPEAFLAIDELFSTMRHIIDGQIIDNEAIRRTLDAYAPFSATERVLMALGKRGADRQIAHERLRNMAMLAWQAVREGNSNPLKSLIESDEFIASFLSSDTIEKLFDVDIYIGAAEKRALAMAGRIRRLAMDEH
ncbi:MAG: adenylosuccinate lyase [Spirochaetia bacterium]|nr:adenylosuccinate lyase [Spirochaetia bacterium]NLH90294.1 adenylosuccinate lyase [Treponema sp.]